MLVKVFLAPTAPTPLATYKTYLNKSLDVFSALKPTKQVSGGRARARPPPLGALAYRVEGGAQFSGVNQGGLGVLGQAVGACRVVLGGTGNGLQRSWNLQSRVAGSFDLRYL